MGALFGGPDAEWLLCARRLLSTTELIAAASVQPGEGTEGTEDFGKDDSDDNDKDEDKDGDDDLESAEDKDGDNSGVMMCDTVLRACRNLSLLSIRNPTESMCFVLRTHPCANT
jgi:hypothetical protein